MRYIVVFVLLWTSLHADRDGGPYVGVGYGTSQYNDAGLWSLLQEDNTKVINIYAGAYMNKHFSVEINYVDFSSYIVEANSQEKKIDFFAVTMATVVHYPFYDDMLDIYAKFGVGDMRERVAGAKGFTFVYGLGTSWRISEFISLKLAYDVYPFGYDENGDNVSDYNQDMKHIYSALEFQF